MLGRLDIEVGIAAEGEPPNPHHEVMLARKHSFWITEVATGVFIVPFARNKSTKDDAIVDVRIQRMGVTYTRNLDRETMVSFDRVNDSCKRGINAPAQEIIYDFTVLTRPEHVWRISEGIWVESPVAIHHHTVYALGPERFRNYLLTKGKV